MHDEKLGAFVLLFGGPGGGPGRSPGRSPGCPGCPRWVLCGKCRSPFVRFNGVGGLGWLMFEVFGAFMVLYGFDFLALKGWGV